MSIKAILVLGAQTLFIQSAFSSCISTGNYGAGLASCGFRAPALDAPATDTAGSGLACGPSFGYGAGAGYRGLAIEVIPTSGGGLPVSSFSTIGAPSGLSVASENVYEGTLSVAGELPFVSAVALEGVFPSAGAGAISYSCGNGITVIESIDPSAAAHPLVGAAYGPGLAVYGAGVAAGLAPDHGYSGLIGQGCGCGHH